jgi:predicted GNAT family N-acyltransferase
MAFVFKRVTTPNEQSRAFAVRREVFIREQQIDEHEEYDGLDDACAQFVAKAGRRVVGTARLRFPEPAHAKIERMAVLKPWRRQGIGKGILACIEADMVQRGLAEAVLHAQVSAVPFYRACGYEETGARFFEAGIPHVKMVKRLR